ncbi:MAG: guanylate kinase [Actinomycetota bacterium]
MTRRGKLIVLSGPGGVGKSTIVGELKKRDHFYFSVSATTRAPRNGEIDGVAYHFVSPENFQEMINNGVFLEWADFAGARYGTPREPVLSALASGKDVLLEIEIEGARQVKKAMPEAMMVFLHPPSMSELEARITNRGTDSPERIAARLALARAEMAAADEFDHIVTNHRVEEVIDALVSLATS